MMDKIKSIVVLSVVCVIAAGGLAYVNKLTYEARNPAISPAMVKALNLLLPPHDNQLENDVLTVGENKYYVAKQGAEVAAYAFESANSTGYNKTAPIKVLLVVNAKGELSAVSVLGHKETPGLGDKAAKPAFLDQFKAKSLKTAKFAVKKDGGEIEQISGATVTSRAVTLAVKEGLERFHKEVLKEEVASAAPVASAPAVGPSVEVKAEQLKAVLPAFDNDPLKEIRDVNGSRYYVARKGEAVVGYGAYAFAEGFGGKIELIVGLSPEAEVSGVVLLSHGETQGYGKETLETPGFWDAFKGKNLTNAKWAVKQALDAYVKNREALEAAK